MTRYALASTRHFSRKVTRQIGQPRCLRLLKCSILIPQAIYSRIIAKISVAGAFYEHELHRANYPDVYLVEKVLRRRGDEVYVKWLGFDNSHNSWIHKDNVI